MARFVLLRLLLAGAALLAVPGLLPAAYGQKIGADSKGASVFTYYKLEDTRLEFSTEEPLAISLPALFAKNLHYQLAEKLLLTKSTSTIVKKKAATVRLAMRNSGDALQLLKLTELTPGAELKVGYHIAIDSVIDLSHTRGTYTAGGSFTGAFDNFRFYDAVTNTKPSKQYPLSYGLEGYFNRFPKDRGQLVNGKIAHPFRWILSVNGSLQRTWNDDDLLYYQSLDQIVTLPSTVTPQGVVMKDKELAGRYGTLDKSVNKLRFSASVPMFFSFFNVIPYSVVRCVSGSKPRYVNGVLFNVASKRVQYNRYDLPSMVGLGIDYSDGPSIKGQLSVFVRGAIQIGD